MGSQKNGTERAHTQSDRVDGSPWKDFEEAENIDSNENDKRNTSLGSTPSRPHTRSQTGIVLKRRIPDDAAFYAEPNKQTTTGRKKQKESVTDERVDTRQSSSSSSPKPPVTRHPSLGSASTTSRDLSAPLITLWNASPASGDQHDLEPRFPRSRATLPTPIPHLTKKSRGRRVPTEQSSRAATDQKETRLYVCQVEGCAKCFHRGEHLKRHIRSIHTHEKPFQCTYPRCEKYFNRHDNLLQHLKVHREPDERPPILQDLCILPTRYLGEAQVCASQRAESPMDEPVSPVSPLSPVSSPRSIYRRIPSSPYHAYSAPCSITTEPTSIITNMAVSSLRTVLPHSPTENRVHLIPSPRQYGS